MSEGRLAKIERQLQKVLGDIFIQFSQNITRGAVLSVSEVRITPDLAHAKVFVSIFPVEREEEVIEALVYNSKTIRHTLSQELKNMRKVPALQFLADHTMEYQTKLDELLK